MGYCTRCVLQCLVDIKHCINVTHPDMCTHSSYLTLPQSRNVNALVREGLGCCNKVSICEWLKQDRGLFLLIT